MENNVTYWMGFAGCVESTIRDINTEIFSNSYIEKILNLTEQMHKQSKMMDTLHLCEHDSSFSKINHLGSELREMAYFVEYQR